MNVWFQELIYGDNYEAWIQASLGALGIALLIVIAFFGIRFLR